MSDIEHLLQGIRPSVAPRAILERAALGPPRPRRHYFKEAVMLIAAAGLLSLLALHILPAPSTPDGTTPLQAADEWVDAEGRPEDLPIAERDQIASIIVDLGSADPARRAMAANVLAADLDRTAPLLRAAAASGEPEARQLAATLLRTRDQRRPLAADLARARAWIPASVEIADYLVAGALAGDPAAEDTLLGFGWTAAPRIADAARTPLERIRARRMLRQALAPLSPRWVNLTLRHPENAGGSSYSFRRIVRDPTAKDDIDLAYVPGEDGVGMLDVATGSGPARRIADVGESRLEDVRKAPDDGWSSGRILPVKGHVYVEEIGAGLKVKFVILDLGAGFLTFEWTTLDAAHEAWRTVRVPAFLGKVTATHVAIKLVIISVGAADGVDEGSRLTITRSGRYVATLAVAEVNKTWSAGYLLQQEVDPRVGDDVSR